MNVVLYLRYSSSAQTDQSIEGQDRVCTEFCKREKYNIVYRYVDRALTGKSDNRPDFQRMIKDSAKHTFDAIIVYKLDRFARNRYDSAHYKNLLKKNGVRVISATESISTAPEGILMESVLEGMAEYYSAELAQKVRRGKLESAHKGLVSGGAVPYGYDLVNKKYVVNETEAIVVREIFSRYARGEQLIKIANSLNERHIPNKQGREWNKSSFKRMLKSKKYIGILDYNNGQVTIDGGCPAIIDKETFDMAQKQIEEHKHSPQTAKVEFKGLNGKVYCGECGTKVNQTSGHSKSGEKYCYYACKNKKECGCTPISKELLDQKVYEKMLELFSPESVEMIAELTQKVLDRKNNEPKVDEITPLKKKREQLEKEYRFIIDSGKYVEEYYDNRVTEIGREITAIDHEICRKENEVNIEPMTRDFVRGFVMDIFNGEDTTNEFKQELIDKIIARVDVFNDRHIIIYFYFGEDTKPYEFTQEEWCSSTDNVGETMVAIVEHGVVIAVSLII